MTHTLGKRCYPQPATETPTLYPQAPRKKPPRRQVTVPVCKHSTIALAASPCVNSKRMTHMTHMTHMTTSSKRMTHMTHKLTANDRMAMG
jgi:hypothetical protein